MRTHRRCRLACSAASLLSTFMAGAPAIAFDDQEFCVAAQQLALAAEKDIGLWTDRVTRNAGMSVSCTSKAITFERFTYLPTASMNGAWKESKATEWSAAQCHSPIWAEASRHSWKIALHFTAADGGQVSLIAQCK